jgi:HPt (histidine-containing phosphotransfer) domain-containing protein
MSERLAASDDGLGLDPAVFEYTLSMCGPAMRPALIAQLEVDFLRLARALDTPEPARLESIAHEVKGLAATIGATAVAASAARLNEQASAATGAMRAAMALGLRRQIEALGALLARLRASLAA